MSVQVCLSSGNLLLYLLAVFLASVTLIEASCSTEYGAAVPCSFVPAPPGHTPPCAKPGLTYCEHPDRYPGDLIRHLIEKWRYDYSTLLIDESLDEFNAYFYPHPIDDYSKPRPSYGPPIQKQNSYFPEPIYIPKPRYPVDISFYNTANLFRTTNVDLTSKNFTERLVARPPTRVKFRYTENIPALRYPQQKFFQYPEAPPYKNHFIPVDAWNREDNLLHLRTRRSTPAKQSLKQSSGNITTNATDSAAKTGRSKRQAALSGDTLCQSTSQFVMPRAALNNQGNWMYVVNMPELDNRYTQLVKTETCRSQTCSAICNLPNGYISRCEQKYIQKRLVALQGSGNDLYTDLFWLPSCCVCTISNTLN